jgi:hypothetical protein
LLEPTAQLRKRKHADRNVESSRHSATDDDPLASRETVSGPCECESSIKSQGASPDWIWLLPKKCTS